MTQSVEKRFRVAEHADGEVWLELLEGDKAGLLLAIPTTSPEYSEDLREEIDGLEPGITVTARLVSENERNTAWRFTDLDVHDAERDGPVPARADG